MWIWCVFGVTDDSPLFSLWGVSKSTHPWGLDTRSYQLHCLLRAPTPEQGSSDQFSTNRGLSGHVRSLGATPHPSANLGAGGGATSLLRALPILSFHPIMVPPSGGWAGRLHSKLLAPALGSQPGTMRCCCCYRRCYQRPPCALKLLLLLPLGECGSPEPRPGCKPSCQSPVRLGIDVGAGSAVFLMPGARVDRSSEGPRKMTMVS